MRRLFPLGLLLCLVLAAPAEAKEVVAAKVCGENGCATSRDRDLIAGLTDGGNSVDPPRAAPFFRVRLTIGEREGRAINRFWMHFVPKGELIRRSDGTWMLATDAYTGALKKVINPDMTAYAASRLVKLLAGDRPVPAGQTVEPPSSRAQADGGTTVTTAGSVGGALAGAVLLGFAVRRRRRRRRRPAPAPRLLI